MAINPGSDTSFSSQKTETARTKKCPPTEEEIFYKNCRAAYLTVFKSSLENIVSKDQLSLALQYAGRNPSQKTINKYWTPQTAKLNFDDFCVILRNEKPVSKAELLNSFKQLDVTDDGFISHADLYKFLTKRGERMTREEVNAIISLDDVNADGRFDYLKFCKLYMTTNEQCLKTALEKLEVDSKLRRQQFGSRKEGSPESHPLPGPKPSPGIIRKTDQEPPSNKGDTRNSLLETTVKFKSSVSFIITMGVTSNRNSKLTEPNSIKVFGWTGELGPGIYWLIPSTTGCRLRRDVKPIAEEAQLVGRDDTGELFLTKEFRSALSDIFDIMDLDGNGLLSLEEYNFFELRTSGEKCDEDAWAVCRENFETKKNELTKQGFMDLNLMEANDQQGDPADLWVTLHSMGYNKALELTEACPFVIEVYADKSKPRMKAVQMEACSGQLEKAICKSVLSKGEAKAMDGYDNIIVHTYKHDNWITSVIENKSDNKAIIHINNEQSKNCVNNRGLNIFAVEVANKSAMVCQHVMPLDERQEGLSHCVYSLVS
ncbi:EF-hand calcium-binding domain-containing protein 7 isoform X1 [Sorex fumeus]|uniref:EF-hand calcium-binding domain-containing protein 7 isoform X1 n=1 Tax=Sorex fumeus TaxID=62283 RepID=UPI0024AD9776|nr:EF-hand calcium-binding domain-containing protein 7 isoform X1 [Sorex fumeus]XP_055978232.1 EF-hand calcium-binding domain-containing protein 7 isoform X1 [Sorex fumeus]